MEPTTPTPEPLPIWFFVGIILTVYGAIVLLSGLLVDSHPTVLQELRPALWWGGVMLFFGIAFSALGWLGHARAARAEKR